MQLMNAPSLAAALLFLRNHAVQQISVPTEELKTRLSKKLPSEFNGIWCAREEPALVAKLPAYRLLNSTHGHMRTKLESLPRNTSS